MTLISRAADRLKEVVGKGSKEDGEKWLFLKEKYDLAMELRLPFERGWLITLAFIGGKQYTVFNSVDHSLRTLKRVPGSIKSTDNKMLPAWQRMISDLIKTSPEMSVVPATTEEEDVKAAKVGEKFLKSFWQSNRMKKKIRKLAGWVYSTGNAFLDDRWNPKLGPVTVNEKGQFVYAGDVDCGVWSPFEIGVPFASMGDSELHDFPWLTKAKWRGLDYLAENYGKKGARVVAEALPRTTVSANSFFGAGSGMALGRLPGALLIELYVKPCGLFPKGKFLVGANGVLLEEAEFPFQKFNLEHFKDVDMPGIFWGKAKAQEAIGLQRSWNRTISSIDEFNVTAAKGKILEPRGANLEVSFDDTHGQVIKYTPVLGHKPDWMTLKGLPPTIGEALNITRDGFQGLFSQHEVTEGTNKSDIRSGEMVSLLREQDAHGNIPSHASFEENIELTMGRILKRVKEGYTTQRMIQVAGRDGEFEVLAFKGADLRNNTDVSVKRQSSQPDSRIAREARIRDNFKQGLYGNPQDPKVLRHVMEMIEDAPVNQMFGTDRQDESLARWENEQIMRGVPVMVNPYDNHAIHLEVLDKQQKSIVWQRGKVDDPEGFGLRETIALQHRAAHQEFLAEQRAAMLEEQIALKGGGNDRQV